MHLLFACVAFCYLWQQIKILYLSTQKIQSSNWPLSINSQLFIHLMCIVISFWEEKDLDVISQADVFDMEFVIFWLFWDAVDIILNTYLNLRGTLQMWEIMSNNFFSCLIWIIIISSVENLYTKYFYSKIYWNIYKLQCFVHCMNGEVEVAIVDTKAAKSLISLC